MPHIALLINTDSGNGNQEETLMRLLSSNKYSQFALSKFDPKKAMECVSDLVHKGFTTIVAAGGDGTVSAIAGALLSCNFEVKFAVLPLGTFNHFAKDLGMPSGIEEALDVISKGNTKYIDVAKVNDTYFLNNSSLGVYPKLVKLRQEFQRKGWHKAIALCAAIIAIEKRDAVLTVDFEADNKKILKRTPMVFVGNNKYELEGLSVGERKYLDRGLLTVGIVADVSKLRLFGLAFHALRGNLIDQKDFTVIGLTRCTIVSHKGKVEVSHDGEISLMNSPLEYQILPKAISVILP